MQILISNHTTKPIYEQITSQIKHAIMSGELKSGDPLPSMRALAKDLHISVRKCCGSWYLCILTEQRIYS